MKKILILILCTILALSVLFMSCGKKNNSLDPQGEVLMTMGIVSDSQLRPDSDATGNMLNSKDQFKKSLEYFKTKNVDAILMNGDIVDYATKEAYDVYNEVLNCVFSNNNEKPILIYSPGNHECHLLTDKNQSYAWELFTQETGFDKDMYVEVNGIPVISIGTKTYENCIIDSSSIEFLKSNIERASKVANGKPIIVASHGPIKNTVYGSEGSDATPQGGEIYNILKNYQNAILFTSHSHYPLIDERSISQNAFTMINTGTSSYTCVGVKKDDKFCNSAGYAFSNVYQNSAVPMENDLTNAKANEIATGLIMKVYKNVTIYERVNFNTNKTFGKIWKVPTNTSKDDFLYDANRQDKLFVPNFNDVKVAATKNTSKITVLFDEANCESQIESYRIVVCEEGKDKIVVEKTVVSDYWTCNEVKGKYKVDLTVANYYKNYIVNVYAYNCFGVESEKFEILLKK